MRDAQRRRTLLFPEIPHAPASRRRVAHSRIASTATTTICRRATPKRLPAPSGSRLSRRRPRAEAACGTRGAETAYKYGHNGRKQRQ